MTTQKKITASIAAHSTLLLLLLAAGNYLFAAWALSFNYPSMDEWPWLKELVLPYSRGDLSFFDVVSSQYEGLGQSHILTLASILWSYLHFQLNFVVLAFVGHLSFIIAVAYVARKHIFAHVDGTPIQFALLYAAVFALVFTIASKNTFASNLIAFEQVYIALGLVAFCLIDAQLPGPRALLLILLTSIILLLLGSAIGGVAFFAILGSYAILSILQRGYLWKVAPMLAGFSLVQVFNVVILPGGIEEQGALARLGSYLMANPEEVWKLLGIVGSSALVEFDPYRRALSNHYVWVRTLCGLSVIPLFLTCYYTYFRRELFLQTRLPLFLLLFSVFAVGGILINRVPLHNVEYMAAGRYLRLYVLGGFGLLSVMVLHLGAGASKRASRIYLLVAALVLSGQLWSSYLQWQRMDIWRNAQRKELAAANHYLAGEPSIHFETRHPACAGGGCRDVIHFLQDNRLTIFARAKWPERVLLWSDRSPPGNSSVSVAHTWPFALYSSNAAWIMSTSEYCGVHCSTSLVNSISTK
jgi:hypothetical protein